VDSQPLALAPLIVSSIGRHRVLYHLFFGKVAQDSPSPVGAPLSGRVRVAQDLLDAPGDIGWLRRVHVDSVFLLVPRGPPARLGPIRR
jgi:hypothetical protein